jgi:hypothetical protein
VLLGCVKDTLFPPFLSILFPSVRIYLNPELSSKDSASVVCPHSMGALLFVVLLNSHGVQRNLHLFSAFWTRKSHSRAEEQIVHERKVPLVL